MAEVSASVEDEVFVGPITLHEMKIRLRNKYHTLTSNKRHTVIGLPSSEYRESVNAVAKENDSLQTRCIQEDSLTGQNSVVYVEDEDVTELMNDITTITLSSDEEISETCESPKRESSKLFLDESTQTDDIFGVRLKKEETVEPANGTSCIWEHSESDASLSLKSEPKIYFSDIENERSYFQNGAADSLLVDYDKSDRGDHIKKEEEEQEKNNCVFDYDYYDNKSQETAANNVDYNRFTNDNEYFDYSQEDYKENTPQKRTLKSNKKNYDYLISSVGQYIRQKKPMAPPPPPNPARTEKKQQKTLISHNNKKSAYKNIVSPLSVYINSSPSAPLFKEITPKPMKHFKAEPCSSTNKISSLNNLPKVVYKPAQMKILLDTKVIKLPPSVKKLCPQSITTIDHTGRVTAHNRDITTELEKTDLSCMSSAILNEDISVLNVKDAYNVN